MSLSHCVLLFNYCGYHIANQLSLNLNHFILVEHSGLPHPPSLASHGLVPPGLVPPGLTPPSLASPGLAPPGLKASDQASKIL